MNNSIVPTVELVAKKKPSRDKCHSEQDIITVAEICAVCRARQFIPIKKGRATSSDTSVIT